MKDKLTYIVQKQRHPKKPILSWKAIDKFTNNTIDQNKEIKFLKAIYGDSAHYIPVS